MVDMTNEELLRAEITEGVDEILNAKAQIDALEELINNRQETIKNAVVELGLPRHGSMLVSGTAVMTYGIEVIPPCPEEEYEGEIFLNHMELEKIDCSVN